MQEHYFQKEPTVIELIEILKQFPQDAVVFIKNTSNYYDEVRSIVSFPNNNEVIIYSRD